MKFVRSILIAVAITTSTLSYAEEIINDNVIQDQVDVKQDIHWTWCGSECRKEAKKKANRVLRRLDDLAKNYDTHEDFYSDASDIFKRKASMDQWSAAFEHRNKLENPRRRIHESTQGIFRNLPNVDKNRKYVIVTFDTMFEGEKGIFTEQITLILKNNNKYKFVGYYFSKKPYYEYKE